VGDRAGRSGLIVALDLVFNAPVDAAHFLQKAVKPAVLTVQAQRSWRIS
jgi:hypothetical protein